MMTATTRRRLLLLLAATPLAAATEPQRNAAEFAALERDLKGELGVAVIDRAGKLVAGHRQDRRFPMCSTFKAVLAAAILARADAEPALLERRLALPAGDFAGWSPVTEQHKGGTLSVAELCAAIVQYSDNTAANALLRVLGGPAALTHYARGLGDPAFRLDRRELELNTAIPGDPRDTTTPLAMARTLRKLLLQDGLAPPRQAQLRDWLLGNTRGGDRIRAAVPAGWQVADKPGTGAYGTCHDIAVVYPPDRPPLVLAIYTRRPVKDADAREDIVAAAARIALRAAGA